MPISHDLVTNSNFTHTQDISNIQALDRNRTLDLNVHMKARLLNHSSPPHTNTNPAKNMDMKFTKFRKITTKKIGKIYFPLENTPQVTIKSKKTLVTLFKTIINTGSKKAQYVSKCLTRKESHIFFDLPMLNNHQTLLVLLLCCGNATDFSRWIYLTLQKDRRDQPFLVVNVSAYLPTTGLALADRISWKFIKADLQYKYRVVGRYCVLVSKIFKYCFYQNNRLVYKSGKLTKLFSF